MREKKNNIIAVILTLIVLLIGAGCSGCQTTLDPTGVYQGDIVLYNVDNTLNGAYATMDTFLKWEYDNRAVYASMPEVKRAADNIRMNGQNWIESAFALRDAYAANPTDENKDKLLAAVAILRTALLESAKYMAKSPPTQ